MKDFDLVRATCEDDVTSIYKSSLSHKDVSLPGGSWGE